MRCRLKADPTPFNQELDRALAKVEQFAAIAPLEAYELPREFSTELLDVEEVARWFEIPVELIRGDPEPDLVIENKEQRGNSCTI